MIDAPLDVFVTVGMGRFPFDRLLAALDPVAARHHVFAQTGASAVEPPCPHAAAIAFDEFDRRLRAADRGEADLVFAMGSLQYTDDPAAVVARFASWVKPGGAVVVLVDSLVALVLELLARGEHDEARQRAETRLGWWDAGTGAPPAALRLFNRRAMEDIFIAAGLDGIRSRGLLVSSSALGPAGLEKALCADLKGTMTRERQLADEPALADAGKQLLVIGRRPNTAHGAADIRTRDHHPSR